MAPERTNEVETETEQNQNRFEGSQAHTDWTTICSYLEILKKILESKKANVSELRSVLSIIANDLRLRRYRSYFMKMINKLESAIPPGLEIIYIWKSGKMSLTEKTLATIVVGTKLLLGKLGQYLKCFSEKLESKLGIASLPEIVPLESMKSYLKQITSRLTQISTNAIRDFVKLCGRTRYVTCFISISTLGLNLAFQDLVDFIGARLGKLFGFNLESQNYFVKLLCQSASVLLPVVGTKVILAACGFIGGPIVTGVALLCGTAYLGYKLYKNREKIYNGVETVWTAVKSLWSWIW